MDRSKIVAVVTGAIAIVLSIAYLLVVQILDFRGEMLPAPLEMIPPVGLHSVSLTHTEGRSQSVSTGSDCEQQWA